MPHPYAVAGFEQREAFTAASRALILAPARGADGRDHRFETVHVYYSDRMHVMCHTCDDGTGAALPIGEVTVPPVERLLGAVDPGSLERAAVTQLAELIENHLWPPIRWRAP